MAVDPILPSEGLPSEGLPSYDTIPKESENDIVQILFITLESDELGSNLPTPSQQEENPPVLMTQGVNSTIYLVFPSSNLVTSFDWNRLARSHLPSYVPFQIIVQV